LAKSARQLAINPTIGMRAALRSMKKLAPAGRSSKGPAGPGNLGPTI
jgi:hypothetical protein